MPFVIEHRKLEFENLDTVAKRMLESIGTPFVRWTLLVLC